MILNSMKKPDLDNEISINLTEREFLMLTVAIRRISPADCANAVSVDFNVDIGTPCAVADELFPLCSEMRASAKCLGYIFKED